jgi:nickel-dependent lactate racemase
MNSPAFVQKIAPTGFLDSASIRETLVQGLAGCFSGQSVLVLIPDHTRSLPLPFLFKNLAEILGDTRKLTFMVALGTHPELTGEQMNKLVGISADERRTTYKHVELLNHAWKDPAALTTLGIMEDDEIRTIAGERWHSSLPTSVKIEINRAALDYDRILIIGPTFPHEVVGFSGGEKYLFPGVSGAEMIDTTHWLGALSGVVGTIGIKDTPVRRMIHAAASRLDTPVTLVALNVHGEEVSGIFIGDPGQAWSACADLSAQQHITWCEKPYQRVLSCAPAMYDELWTAAKAMYKIEPAVAVGGEVIVYAPHLDTVSFTHGKYIYQVGYHILPYFLANWDKFKGIPLGVLAHSTHFRGSGVMEGEREVPNVKLTLASKISAEDCAHLGIGYLDPAKVRPEEWKNREQDGMLYVARAGETLYRVKN